MLRCFVLWLLARMNAYKTNLDVVTSVAQKFGFRVDADKILTECHWLMRQGYVSYSYNGLAFVVLLTERGLDVEAFGGAPGVASAYEVFEKMGAGVGGSR